ncbi:flagellar basal body-associated FliL family protein [Oceanicella actignis]|uniref:Flagellar protein FliL n=1 Tax=Oceanicella actignis TaxID=1189325 RepID=A0A1M7T645_9RHOB|nr:flagellar basal body-associated FliL family protein [Oceanicella actignis]SET44300.1 Flagellar basal body-associated protein FliL [Oceanicella actignis]SHN66214.1 Flagellar basal body-associated protein FliL [Oceanicella actignis]
MKKLLPILLAVIGLVGGAVAGAMLRPPPAEDHAKAEAHGGADPAHAEGAAHDEHAAPDEEEEQHDPEKTYEFAKLDKQFIVPIVRNEEIAALAILSLTLEMEPGTSGAVSEREPKLRDELLQALFLHAQSGGFDGDFTSPQVMKDLRGALKKAARKVMGPAVHDVLLTEFVRQDL